MKFARVECDFSSRRGVLWVLSEPGSRSGETASPKRDVVVMCDALLAF